MFYSLSFTLCVILIVFYSLCFTQLSLLLCDEPAILAAFCSQHSDTFAAVTWIVCIVRIMPCFGERSKANPSIAVQDLVDAMQSYMDLKKTRDVWEIFKEMRNCQYANKLPMSTLVSYSDCAQIFAKVCTAGVLPSKKFHTALSYMNAEVKPGVGIMKVNFTGKPDGDVWDHIDDKIKIILKNFRELRSDPDKLNALFLKIDKQSRIKIQAVIDEMTDVPIKPGRSTALSADSAVALHLPLEDVVAEHQIAFCFADQYSFLYYIIILHCIIILYYIILFYIALLFFITLLFCTTLLFCNTLLFCITLCTGTICFSSASIAKELYKQH